MIKLFVITISLLSYPLLALADEVVVRSIDLPGASIEQEITYHPSEKIYIKARDSHMVRLRNHELGAMVNPIEGPWMIVETTAKIGIFYQGFGISRGKKYLRKVTAAEEALYRFKKINN